MSPPRAASRCPPRPWPLWEELYPQVKDGTIVPAANFNGYTPEEFPGL